MTKSHILSKHLSPPTPVKTFTFKLLISLFKALLPGKASVWGLISVSTGYLGKKEPCVLLDGPLGLVAS